MPIRLVTLDCANTLLRGSWDPVRFALEASQAAGLCLPRRASEIYGALLRRHYPSILKANRTGDPAVVREAYLRLGAEWLQEVGIAPSLSKELVDEADRLLPELFEPFADTMPFLDQVRKRDVRLAIVSNWDVSLNRVLAAHGILGRVDDVYASLVVGAEKPDPTMIRLAMRHAGVAPEETMHVGDDPLDDLGAAANAGVRGVLIDRAAPSGSESISSLMEVLAWID